MSMTLPTKPSKSVDAALSKLRDHSSSALKDRVIERRAFEAVVWGMPAVNFDLLYRAMEKSGGKWNQIVYWSRLFDWKNQTLTPNPDVIYVIPFFDTREAGPMVMEIPPAGEDGSFTGSIDNGWQIALEDVGPAGIDQGKGGKYLILPPDYKATAPDGYIALSSDTYRSYALLRSNSKSGSDHDIAKAAAYAQRVKIYPLSQAANPPATIFIDAIDTVYDSTIPYDVRFFRALDRFVQHEPWLQRDRAMIDILKSVGIEKGKTFQPAPGIQGILEDAAADAHAWLENNYEEVFSPPFNERTHWALPVTPDLAEDIQTNFAKADRYPVSDRGVTYSMAFFSAKHLGAGQFYLMTIKDRDGKDLDSASTYRLTVPARAPVRLYWSATVYDRKTHALIRNSPYSSRSSKSPGLQVNANGSVDVYFGAKAPAGKQSNWVPIGPDGQFEVLFRFYGPDKPLFDKTWVLPDIEKQG